MNLLNKRLVIFCLCVVAFILLQIFFMNKNCYLQNPNIVNVPQKISILCTFDLSAEKGILIHQIKNASITSYTNREQETDSTPNITATGRMVYEGSVAVSQDLFRKRIHPGDIVYIKKLNRYFIVEDTTNARLKNTFDIFMFKEDLKQSKQFGLIKSDVLVYKLIK